MYKYGVEIRETASDRDCKIFGISLIILTQLVP